MADKSFGEMTPDEQERTIKKLLGIHKHVTENKNEGEAANAAAKLTEQLERFNLTLADLQRRGDMKKLPYGLHRIRYKKPGEARYKWKAGLLGDLARFNGASAYTHGDSDYMSIVAEEHTFRVIEELYNELVKKAMGLMGVKLVIAQRTGRWTPSRTLKFQTDWLEGFRGGVWTKLEDRRKYFEQTAGQGTMALVLYREEELNEAISKFMPNAGKAKTRTIRYSDEYIDGMQTGYAHNYEKEVNGGK